MSKEIKKFFGIYSIILAVAVLFNAYPLKALADNWGCIAADGRAACSPTPNDTSCDNAAVQACKQTACIPIESASCGKKVAATINKTSFVQGDQLTITFTPSLNLLDLTGHLIINGITGQRDTEFGNKISVDVTTDTGFKLNGTNTIKVVVTNDNDNNNEIPIDTSGIPPTITVGTIAGGTQTQTPSTPSGQTGNNTITGPTNPIQDTNLFDLFFRLLKILMGILGAIAVLMIIIGGFRMVIAQGNEEAYTKAKSTITWAIIGLVIALLSFSIVIIVQNILGANLPSVNTDSNGSVQVK